MRSILIAQALLQASLPVHAAMVTDVLCRLDAVERALTDESFPVKKMNLTKRSLKVWRSFEDELNEGIRRNLVNNHAQYVAAYKTGHPHVRFMAEEWGLELGESRQDVRVPSIGAFFQAYYRKVAKEIEAGRMAEKDVMHPVRIFFKEYGLFKEEGEVEAWKTSVGLLTDGFAKSAPEIVRRLVRDRKIRSGEDLAQGKYEALAPKELIFVRYGEEVPEGAIPWPTVLGDRDYASLVASGQFPLSEPGEIIRNGENLTPAEHDLGHFTGFLEKDAKGRLSYLKNFRKFAAAWLEVFDRKIAKGYDSGLNSDRERLLFLSEYSVDVKPIPKNLLHELFPVTVEKAYSNLSDQELEKRLGQFFKEMPEASLIGLAQRIERNLWQLLTAYGGGVRDLFTYVRGDKNLLTRWERVSRILRRRTVKDTIGYSRGHLIDAMAGFQFEYLLMARNEIYIAREMQDFFEEEILKNEKLKRVFCRGTGYFKESLPLFCR